MDTVRLSTTVVKGNQLTNPPSLKPFAGNTKGFSVLKALSATPIFYNFDFAR